LADVEGVGVSGCVQPDVSSRQKKSRRDNINRHDDTGSTIDVKAISRFSNPCYDHFVPSTHAADILTARLRLLATTADHLRIELDHPEKLGAALGVHVPEGWPPGLYDQDAMRFFLAKAIEGGDDALGWFGWYAICREKDESQPKLVAAGGYFGPPTPEGDIEIGYSVVEQERCKGYATELVKALVTRAFESNSVKRVFAEVDQTNHGSIKVLERSGFVRFGPGREEGHWRLLFQGFESSQ